MRAVRGVLITPFLIEPLHLIPFEILPSTPQNLRHPIQKLLSQTLRLKDFIIDILSKVERQVDHDIILFPRRA
ncbi:hypothetical protein GYMLUDRAFT_584619 [Collybiopsis luxurians FD-317 M1]|uniref:Uncharacterized protein n=1 Tax=Collybiopsis luxurians FD-317 M1 TaxID=944289 RepID=A0A0D0C002_9AGAR|nr:hypothetical protein GYMLUDRAFT_584619 [Collybiopsis luxurians FD-317 M1]